MSAQESAQNAQIWHLHQLGVPFTKIGEKVGLHRNTVRVRVAFLAAQIEGASRQTPPETDPAEVEKSA